MTGLYSSRLGQLTNSRIFSPLFPVSYKNDGFCLCANTDAVTAQLHIWRWRQTRQVGVDLRRRTTINHISALCDITKGWFLMQLSLLFVFFVFLLSGASKSCKGRTLLMAVDCWWQTRGTDYWGETLVNWILFSMGPLIMPLTLWNNSLLQTLSALMSSP